MAIRVGRMMLLFLVSSLMMAHLGIKPVSGGRPPRDIRMVSIAAVIRGALFHVWARESAVVLELMMRSMNMGIVRMM